MNDRLRIASEQLASMQHMDRADRVRAALEEADALLAAAGEQETREPKPGEIDRYYLEQALAAAEARAAALQAKLDEAARLARETAGEAMAVAGGKVCVWTRMEDNMDAPGCPLGERWHYNHGLKFCPHCGGEIVKGGE